MKTNHLTNPSRTISGRLYSLTLQQIRRTWRDVCVYRPLSVNSQHPTSIARSDGVTVSARVLSISEIRSFPHCCMARKPGRKSCCQSRNSINTLKSFISDRTAMSIVRLAQRCQPPFRYRSFECRRSMTAKATGIDCDIWPLTTTV